MDCTSPIYINGDTFPCGKCLNCRARSRQEWVFRLRMEYAACDFGLFVTLTYNDETLPPDGVSVRDCQLFLKRLRKHYKSNTLRYYLCSEYGDHTERWHYHALLFFKGLDRKDMKNIYDTIEAAWSNGFCYFGDIEEGSIVYVTKYCLKGSFVPPGKNDNFRILSKMNGGIGANYIELNKDYHLPKLDKPRLVHYQGKTAPMPRYYRNKLMQQLGDDLEDVKIMYQISVKEARDKREKDIRSDFNYKYPNLATDDHAYIMWRHGRQDRKEELYLKHTKKQNVM